jgi:hypothetical protein
MLVIVRHGVVYTYALVPAYEGPLDVLLSHVTAVTCTLRVTDDEREALFVTRAGMARHDEIAM